MERRKKVFRRAPVERSHREIIILCLADSELFGKILERIKGVAGIEFFIVFSTTASHLAIMPGREWTNFLMQDSKFL